jgi:type I restriction enzyme S subunit
MEISQKIPNGYKQTEIGIIPEDWDLKRLDEIIDKFVNGGTPSTQNIIFWNGNIPWITGADILNQKVAEIRRHITSAAVKKSSTNVICKGNLLLVSRTGVGKLAIAPCDIAISQDFTGIYPKKESLLAEYLFRFFDFHKIFLKNSNQGTSIQGITRETLAAFLIPLPTKTEQSAIGTVLFDIDSLIENLEKLIEKKKLIKQGAMQELLTVKKRLSGFNGKWEAKRLGELLYYEQPTKYIVKSDEYSSRNNIPVLTAGKSFILGYTNEENNIFRDLPAIIFDDFTTASQFVDFPFKVKSSAIKILKPVNKHTDLRFVFGKMQLINFKLGDHKRYWISEYQNVKIDIPDTVEQSTIANILSNMDAEIDKLEVGLSKYKNIKQGMMQTLLTGKIRLI